MYKNIIITSANSTYYSTLLTLINGIHRYGLDCTDKIIIYDLGLSEDEVKALKLLKLVQVVNFPDDVIRLHKLFMEPNSHVYKLYCMFDAKKYSENILWLDAGCTPINPMCIMFDIIHKEEIFMVVDEHITRSYTHSDCIKITSATEEELSDNMLSSGIIGYKSTGKYVQLFKDAYEYSVIEGCVDGDHENHRHDQSVLSILATRYSCPKQDIDIYGYWTNSNRNLQTALSRNSIIYVHRRGYYNVNDLVYED